MGKCSNVNGDHVGVWCAASATRLQSTKWSQNKVTGIKVIVALFFNVPLMVSVSRTPTKRFFLSELSCKSYFCPSRWCSSTRDLIAMFGKAVTVSFCSQVSIPLGASLRTLATPCPRTPLVVITSRDDATKPSGCPSWSTTPPAPIRRPTNWEPTATPGSGSGTAVWQLAAAHRDCRWAKICVRVVGLVCDN